jgi:hypothetical protein
MNSYAPGSLKSRIHIWLSIFFIAALIDSSGTILLAAECLPAKDAEPQNDSIKIQSTDEITSASVNKATSESGAVPLASVSKLEGDKSPVKEQFQAAVVSDTTPTISPATVKDVIDAGDYVAPKVSAGDKPSDAVELGALAPSGTVSLEPTYKVEIKIDAPATAVLPLKSPAEQIDEITNQLVASDDNRGVSKSRKIFRKLGDMAQYATTCKGFHSSSEGADLILSEKEKELSKNSTAVEYLKQKRYDGLHAQVAGCVFQIAMGLGASDSSHKEQCVNSGYSKLKDLVGEEKAQSLLSSLTSWSEQVKSEDRKLDLDTLDVLTMQNKSVQVLNTALQNDELVKVIRTKLHKYNGHSKFSQISNKVINTSLSLAALTPTFVSPAAQVTQFLYVAATGGPEESKLLKELYFDRRLEERLHRLSQETNLALANYNIAILTKNPALLGCCESMIKKMVGEEGAAAILPSSASHLAQAN